MELLDKKKALRGEMQARRNKLNKNEVKTLSESIAAKLSLLKPVEKARTIMGFYSIRNEVDIILLLEKFKNEGRTVLLPRVGKKGLMDAVELKSWGETAPGPFNIIEPQGEPYDTGEIDVVLVPGLAFDYKGCRIGYGKGYYDRFLPRLGKNTFICGVCYDFQVVEDVFPRGRDVPVHWVVTDKSELVIDWQYF